MRKDDDVAETNRLTSDRAVNAAERAIARTMDDEKQREDSAMARPKEQGIARMIDGAEQKQDEAVRASEEAGGHLHRIAHERSAANGTDTTAAQTADARPASGETGA